MAEYWLKTDAEAEPQGPYHGSDLKAFVAAGQIEPDWLVSPDQQKWVAANRVSGLVFPTPMTASQPAPLDAFQYADAHEPAPVDDQSPPGAVPALAYATPALSYAVPGVYSGGQPGKYRNLIWLVIASSTIGVIQILANGIQQFGGPAMTAAPAVAVRAGAAPVPSAASNPAAWVLIGISISAACAMMGFFIYLLVWVYKVHNEMRTYTGGRYPISPGKALGFSFIPFYSLYWDVHMPGKLADHVHQRLGNGSTIINPSTIRTLCIAGVIAGIFLPGAQLLLLSLAFYKLQNGLNAMWGLSGT